MGLIVYGASDNLVEIEGDVREEFGMPIDDKAYLATDAGHVVEILYDGIWRLRVLAGDATRLHEGDECADPVDGRAGYSDHVQLNGSVRHVILGEGHRRATRPSEPTDD